MNENGFIQGVGEGAGGEDIKTIFACMVIIFVVAFALGVLVLWVLV